MKQISEISSCRVCDNPIKPLFSIGEQFVNNFPSTKKYGGLKCPIDIVQCCACELVQMKHSAPNDLLYSRKYWYKSGINKRIVDDLKEIAEVAMSYMNDGDSIIDIGANDGTLLSFIDPKYNRVGIEPAKNLLTSLVKNSDTAVSDFWNGCGS